MEEFTKIKSNYGFCQDQDSAIKTFNALSGILYGKIKSKIMSSCPIPCEQTSYSFTTKFYHLNSWIFPDNRSTSDIVMNGVKMIISYENLLTEERIETLVYDIGSFLASAGGNLGLFLSFSCLSILLGAIDMFKKYNNA